jgi:alpha-N-arabinofuranosidase
VQATGHADLVELPDKSWAMVLLGIRPPDGQHHHLGRETFLAQVRWEDGWPVVNEGRPIDVAAGTAPRPVRDDFDEPTLPLRYVHVRNPRSENYSLGARPGWLRLLGTNASVDDVTSPTFVGRRQEHLWARVETHISFEPSAGQAAGLVLRSNEDNHYDVLVTREGNVRVVRALVRVKGHTDLLSEAVLPDGDVVIRVLAYADRYEFFADVGGNAVELGQAGTVPLSSEVAGGFTGVVFGLYATGAGAVADFDYLSYVGDQMSKDNEAVRTDILPASTTSSMWSARGDQR